MRHHLKFEKQLSFTQYLLLFPIAGLLELKNDLRMATINEFTARWVAYLFLTAFWCLIIGGGIYVICTRPMALIPISIPLGIIFLLIIVPRIIYKCINRKHRK